MSRSNLASLAAAACLAVTAPSVASAACASGPVQADDRRLWAEIDGDGAPTVVFEAGGGETSQAWTAIAPAIRAAGATTIVYDRAGLGRSGPTSGPYRIEDEVEGLRGMLTSCGVTGPVILVAHSYGGFIALLAAAEDARVAGMVLVDATLPDYFDEAALAALLAEFRPQYDAVRQAAPALAEVLIPIIEAYPQTVDRVRAAGLPTGLPVTDIVAGDPMPKTPEADDAWRRAHAAFVARGPNREIIVAEGSGHAINRDRPDVVIAAVLRMVETVRAARDQAFSDSRKPRILSSTATGRLVSRST